MAYQITSSLKATFAGNFARYRYANNPMGTQSFENGLHPDITTKYYLKNEKLLLRGIRSEPLH